MDPFDQETPRAALIRIAREVAGDPSDAPRFLRRFRVIYLHLAATVDGASARNAATMAGPVPVGWNEYAMQTGMMPPNPEKLREGTAELLDSTEAGLAELR
ncbi:MAG: hypothetical protein M3472_04455 [Chloroflexota bacterium]|nr:hypothetical protein [Chloroflexota bacterium]